MIKALFTRFRIVRSVGQVFAAILLAAIAPLAITGGLLALNNRSDVVQRETRALHELVVMAGEQYRQMLEAAGHALTVDHLQMALVAQDRERCNTFLARQVADHPFLLAALAISRDGIIRCASGNAGIGNDVSDRRYFRLAKVVDGLVVTEPVVARPSSRWVAPVARRIRGLDPEMARPDDILVIGAALELDAFVQRVRQIARSARGGAPTDLSAWLVNADGIVLADAGTPARRGNSAPFWTGEVPIRGTLDGVDFDGTPVTVAVSTRLPGDVFLVAAKRSADITAEADMAFRVSVIAGVLSMVMGLALAYLLVTGTILRPLTGLTRAAEQLRHGGAKVAVPQGPFLGELEELRHAFSAMAGAVAERERLLALRNAELSELSMRDGLTGVGNRRAFDRYLQEAWDVALRRDEPVSALFLDVDHFKAYNDREGHQAGDGVLRALAYTLAHLPLRDHDLVCRYGGEEFVIILPGTSEAGAKAVAERALVAVRSLRIPHPASSRGIVTVSIGVATARPHDGGQPEELVSHADAALYAAKREGRDLVRLWDADSMASGISIGDDGRGGGTPERHALPAERRE